MAPSDLDRFDDREPFDRFKVADLVGEPLIAFGQNRHLVDRLHLYCLSSKLCLGRDPKKRPDPDSIVKDHALEAE